MKYIKKFEKIDFFNNDNWYIEEDEPLINKLKNSNEEIAIKIKIENFEKFCSFIENNTNLEICHFKNYLAYCKKYIIIFIEPDNDILYTRDSNWVSYLKNNGFKFYYDFDKGKYIYF